MQTISYLPDVLFDSNPMSHVHINDVGVSAHVEFAGQGLVKHAFKSLKE